MSRRSFISDLKYIEAAVQRCRVSGRGEFVFRRLAEFVEAGSFTKSKNMKFLCRYWNRSYDDLGRIWVSQGYKEKNQETFRVQASNLSKMLFSLFPTFCRELFLAEEVMEDDEADFAEIEATIDALENSSGLPEEMFIGEVLYYPDDVHYKKGISVDDCRNAIKKLKPLMRSEVFRYLDDVDTDQLRYILSVMERPLFGARATACDPEKLELLKAFGASESADLTETGRKAEAVKMFIEVPEKTPYNLAFSKSLSDILTQRPNDRLTYEEIKEWTEMSGKERDEYKRKLANFLLVFTEEGFRRQMAHYNPLAVSEVLNGYYPVKEGEQVYQFRK